jgi:hypothetical protein
MGTHIPDGRRKKKKTKNHKNVSRPTYGGNRADRWGADRVESGSNVSPREEKKTKKKKTRKENSFPSIQQHRSESLFHFCMTFEPLS